MTKYFLKSLINKEEVSQDASFFHVYIKLIKYGRFKMQILQAKETSEL